MPGDLLRFFQCLPASDDLEEWSGGLKTALRSLFPEADYVLLSVALTRRKPTDTTVITTLRHQFPNTSPTLTTRTHPASGQATEPAYWRRMIEEGKATRGEFLAMHHPPIGVDAWDNRGAYAGSVALFRRRHKSLFAQETVDLLAEMQDPLAIIFSDYTHRAQLRSPWLERYQSLVDLVSADVPLTEREKEVLALLVLGRDMKEIAGALSLSPYTVKHHVNNLRAKCGGKTVREIIAWYMAFG